MVEYDLKLEVDETQLEEALKDMMKNADWCKPAKVTISAPHAVYLEFGTGPAQGGNSTPRSVHNFVKKDGSTFAKETTDVFYEIYQWAQAKCLNGDPYGFAKKVYKNIMEKGLAPHPFIRPAIHSVEDEFLDILAREGSVLGVAEELARRIEENIYNKDLMHTGELVNSIEASYLEEGEETEDDGFRIEDSVWASDTQDYLGNERDDVR